MSPTALLPRSCQRRKPVHGVTIGILILDTGFERFDRDVGNAMTFDFPVQYAVVDGATPTRALKPDADGMLDLFLRGVDKLVALGVDGISTSCGFISVLHKKLAAYSPVPIATSALLQVPLVNSILPQGMRAGILTADKQALTSKHLAAVGCPLDTPITGLRLNSLFLENCRAGVPVVDRGAQEAEIVEAAKRLVADYPNVGAIVLECTNFPSYAHSVQRHVGVPVYDIITMIEWFHAGLRTKQPRF